VPPVDQQTRQKQCSARTAATNSHEKSDLSGQ
jgi:hypothetical protein